jgi:CBS domain-containing protein
VICIHPDQSLLIAIEKLQRFKIGRLPVTSRFNKKQIVGIITLEDIFKYFGNSKHHEA